ncbi:tripartite tricarboxylate transporter TctB family protein [Hoeflea sp. WL0058]|uniref:Tripartite tricarboxylate transporter TctB family protein n=2 Tax=Flavimaribacter sediminis TaxID=2865987 RepID=A0AAE2ZIW1_9HYPH|nr:tripartite tricarboxylate transporter TctB family protein [Flavimaribacter sediminis]
MVMDAASQKRRQTTIAAGFSLFFLAMLVFGIPYGIPSYAKQGLSLTSSALYPYVITIAGLVFSVLAVIEARTGFVAVSSDDGSVDSLSAPSIIARFSLVVIVFAAFYLLLIPLGALLSSALVFGFLVIFGGERRLLVLVATIIGVPVITYILFAKLAAVPLPRGDLPF